MNMEEIVALSVKHNVSESTPVQRLARTMAHSRANGSCAV